MTEHSLMIIGLPRSGKTTFLAALWHLLDAGEVDTGLILNKLDRDNAYLNAIVREWRRCRGVPRTSQTDERTVAIHVHQPATDRRAVITFPDLSGESFREQIEKRFCKRSYRASCDAADGLLFFIMADRPSDGISLTDMSPLMEGDPIPKNPQPVTEWQPSYIPEQVRLVELLQFLQLPPFKRRRRRLAVLISAWDVVPTPRPAPEEWLQREMPLLHQFLVANQADFDYRCYGISAQGGSFEGEERARLLDMVPSERIECVGRDTAPHDLTAPILWLMAAD